MVIVVVVALAVANLGFVRVSRAPSYDFEWQNGWPFVFLSRNVAVDSGRFRLFDRISSVEVLARNCRGDRLKPLAELRDMAVLVIWSNEVDDEAMRHLTDMRSLVCINLREPNHVTNIGLKYLSELKDLRELDIGASEITNAGLVHLAGLKRLEHLNIMSNEKISDAGLVHLRGLRSLKTLSLIGDTITDAGMKELAGLPDLEKLSLAGTAVTDSGLTELSGLKHLKLLDVRNTAVTRRGLRGFKQAHPGCRWQR